MHRRMKVGHAAYLHKTGQLHFDTPSSSAKHVVRCPGLSTFRSSQCSYQATCFVLPVIADSGPTRRYFSTWCWTHSGCPTGQSNVRAAHPRRAPCLATRRRSGRGRSSPTSLLRILPRCPRPPHHCDRQSATAHSDAFSLAQRVCPRALGDARRKWSRQMARRQSPFFRRHLPIHRQPRHLCAPRPAAGETARVYPGAPEVLVMEAFHTPPVPSSAPRTIPRPYPSFSGGAIPYQSRVPALCHPHYSGDAIRGGPFHAHSNHPLLDVTR